MKVARTLLLTSIVAILIIGICFAQQGGPGAQGQATGQRQGRTRGTGVGFGGARFGRGNPAAMVVRMQEMLNLSEEQVGKLEAITPDDPNAAQKAQQELTAVQQELNAAVMAADAAKIKAACKKLGPATEKTSILQAQEYKKIKEILTAEQFKQYQDLMTRPRRMPGTTPGQGQGGMGGGAGGAGTGQRRRGGGGDQPN